MCFGCGCMMSFMFLEFSWLELDRSIMKVYKRIGKRGGGGIEKERTNGPQKQDLLVCDSRKNQPHKLH